MVARIASLVLAAWLAGTAQAAPPARATLLVTAVIPELAQFRVVAVPPALEITPDDLLRGHVDVAIPSVVMVRTNLRGGFAVQVRMDPALVSAATVSGLDGVAQLAGGAALLRLPGPQRQETRYELRWRLQLAPGATTGTHAWPVEMRLEGL